MPRRDRRGDRRAGAATEDDREASLQAPGLASEQHRTERRAGGDAHRVRGSTAAPTRASRPSGAASIAACCTIVKTSPIPNAATPQLKYATQPGMAANSTDDVAATPAAIRSAPIDAVRRHWVGRVRAWSHAPNAHVTDDTVSGNPAAANEKPSIASARAGGTPRR